MAEITGTDNTTLQDPRLNPRATTRFKHRGSSRRLSLVSELFFKLFSQCVSRDIRYLIDMILHLLPGFRLGIVLLFLQLLDLLNVMSAPHEQETVHDISRKIWICFAQEDSIYRKRLNRSCLSGSIFFCYGGEIGQYCTVVTFKKFKQVSLS